MYVNLERFKVIGLTVMKLWVFKFCCLVLKIALTTTLSVILLNH